MRRVLKHLGLDCQAARLHPARLTVRPSAAASGSGFAIEAAGRAPTEPIVFSTHGDSLQRPLVRGGELYHSADGNLSIIGVGFDGVVLDPTRSLIAP